VQILAKHMQLNFDIAIFKFNFFGYDNNGETSLQQCPTMFAISYTKLEKQISSIVKLIA